ncbi:MAG: Crp/Fnr family transcriptional regulator [Clostridiales bacterium]|jgi:CRP/FNR family transcriptional regulator|nr:Crp/Fnr family transcriptional regulator [Clostridiales bacterium]
MPVVDDYLHLLPYWDKLSETEKDFVKANSAIHSYDKDRVIQGYSDSCLGMIYVIKGSIRVLMISEEGREITLFRLNSGDSCILSAACVLSQITCDTQMIAAENIEIVVVNPQAYSSLMNKNLEVRCFTYELATERFSTVVFVLQQIIFARFDQRLAGFLLEYYDRTGLNKLKMTQEAIAVEVNTAREVVARMLKQFASDGLIEMNRGSITFKDIEGLRMLI